jgi:hypothetical protein
LADKRLASLRRTDLLQHSRKLRDCLTAMADTVFFVASQFSEGSVIAIRLKDRIIAEAVSAIAFFSHHMTITAPRYRVKLSAVRIKDRQHADKMCATFLRRDRLHLIEQVMAACGIVLLTAVTRTVYTSSPLASA